MLPNLIPREVRKPGKLRNELIELPEQLVPVGLDPQIDFNVILSDGTAARLRKTLESIAYEFILLLIEGFQLRGVFFILGPWDRSLALRSAIVILLSEAFYPIDGQVDFLLEPSKGLV